MIEYIISQQVCKLFNQQFNTNLEINNFQVTKTRKDIDGDFTIILFTVLKHSKTNLEQLSEFLGSNLIKNIEFIDSYNTIKGFLNLKIKHNFWKIYISDFNESNFEIINQNPQNIVIEFSSPNTNKPLHLGHIRNNLLGVSLSNLLTYTNNVVNKVSLLNDRGIHICKSMLAWQKWGENKTPIEVNKKGDHFIGEFYVLFNSKYKEEIDLLKKSGLNEQEAIANSELLKEAQKMLKKWERGNKEILYVWKQLNSWVEEGFNLTYKELGVTFDKIYYESETYLKGKDVIMRELSKGSVKINSDNSVSIDLTNAGLDEKILLRADGTTVYITQDIGTAIDRYESYTFDKHIYVVGNEQIYHFNALKEIIKKFGYNWYDKLDHFSYGMVELPEGKMKSREGTVVDADDLIQEMYNTAREKTIELGKIDNLSNDEFEKNVKIIAMGALKYFILKVDPKKNMLFNPNESIDFNGNTGPFIQYSYARINSILEKAIQQNIELSDYINDNIILNDKEIEIVKEIYFFNNVVLDAANNLNPAALANYVFNFAKLFNSYYQEYSILKAENADTIAFRVNLSAIVSKIIKIVLNILGIEVPSKM